MRVYWKVKEQVGECDYVLPNMSYIKQAQNGEITLDGEPT
jgi:hypothetical protein